MQLSRLMGADVRRKKKLSKQGGRPNYILTGASDHPLGGLGFARWACEVRQQEQQMGVFFDTIIVCAVTRSTFAGMIAGFKLLERLGLSLPRKVIGIDASAKPARTRAQVLKISEFTVAKISLSETDITDADVILDDRYHGGTYGVVDQRTANAITWGARTERFITDSVYQGKRGQQA